MVKATLVSKVVVISPEKVLLEMPRETAEILQSIFRYIGGHPKGPRGAVDTLVEELTRIGIGSSVSTAILPSNLEHSVSFYLK